MACRDLSSRKIGTIFDRAYYKRWKYEERAYGIDETYFEILRWANKYASFNVFHGKGKKALDVGCGLGHLAYMLWSYGYDTYAIDISQYAIKRARENFKRLNISVNFAVHDIHEPQPFDKTFDLICCMRALEHFDDPARAIRNIYNALKLGGAFVASTSNKFAIYRWIIHRNPLHVSTKSPIEWHMLFRSLKPSKLRIDCYTWAPLPTRRPYFIKTPLIGRGVRIFLEKG